MDSFETLNLKQLAWLIHELAWCPMFLAKAMIGSLPVADGDHGRDHTNNIWGCARGVFNVMAFGLEGLVRIGGSRCGF